MLLKVVNDKAQLAAFMIAVRSLVRAGIRLRGDLTLAADTQGINYPGEGFGTWWLFNRGVTADYALVGETSGFGLILAECGEVGLEVRTKGRTVYTPRLERGTELREHPSALVRLAQLVPVLEEWAVQYERQARIETRGGTVVPRAQIMRIEGTPSAASMRLDVRLAPGVKPAHVVREVAQRVKTLDASTEVEAFQWSRGYVAAGAELLIDAVHDAHIRVSGAPPPPPPSAEISMWRDLNMFNEVGIPSICYGPPRQAEPYSDAGNRAMKVSDLVAATKVYALTALTVCEPVTAFTSS